MRIIQMIPTLAYGDAVGNDTLAIKRVLGEMGLASSIYAESVVPPYDGKTAKLVGQMPALQKEDVVIFHLSTGSQLNFDVAEMPCRKIVVYHNITPPHFFTGNDAFIEGINRWALEGVAYLKDKADYCLADSLFNKRELEAFGYDCPIDVLPVVIPMADYAKKPDRRIVRQYRKDDLTNIIFTGRIAPNKKQEDVIAAFYQYQRHYNPHSRLILVGACKEEDVYYRRLRKYVEAIGVKNVIFTGHVQFREILAYYKIADLFVCMSEHEGFCVPLVEAMIFGIPIMAYDASAVGETMGEGGLLLRDKDPVFAAGCMERLLIDKQLRAAVARGQKKRLEDFQYEKIAAQFKQYLTAFLK